MKIVVLGAGYAGLRTALDLDRLLREQGRDDSITLVDQNTYHQIIQELHLTATAGIDGLEAIYDLKHLIGDRAIQFVQGRVSALSPISREVQLADGSVLPYDHLVLALGGETAYRNIPGAREHSLALRTYAEAITLRDHIIGQFTAAAKESDPARQRQMLTTAIVGGGYTGCQFAGELAVWVDQLCRQTGAPRREVRIALLDRGKMLLKQFGSWATQQAERSLDRRGVSIYLETAVESVEPGLLRVNGGRVLRAGTIVWTGGVRAPDLIAAAGLPTDKTGRAIVDQYLRVVDQAAIFALGDCAAIPDGPSGTTVPANASYAMRQGAHLAEVLFAELMGSAPRAYEPLHLGELVSLGPDDGIGNPFGAPVVGYTVLLMKKGVKQYYLSTIERA